MVGRCAGDEDCQTNLNLILNSIQEEISMAKGVGLGKLFVGGDTALHELRCYQF